MTNVFLIVIFIYFDLNDFTTEENDVDMTWYGLTSYTTYCDTSEWCLGSENESVRRDNNALYFTLASSASVLGMGDVGLFNDPFIFDRSLRWSVPLDPFTGPFHPPSRFLSLSPYKRVLYCQICPLDKLFYF